MLSILECSHHLQNETCRKTHIQRFDSTRPRDLKRAQYLRIGSHFSDVVCGMDLTFSSEFVICTYYPYFKFIPTDVECDSRFACRRLQRKLLILRSVCWRCTCSRPRPSLGRSASWWVKVTVEWVHRQGPCTFSIRILCTWVVFWSTKDGSPI